MKEAEFDKFAEEYYATHAANIRASGEAPEFFAAYKVLDIAEVLREQAVVTKGLAILDFGGGVGTSVPHFREHFPAARLVCLNVSRKSLAVASQRFPDMADLVQFSGSQIPFADNAFDVAFSACVFHHIDHSEHIDLLKELRRVLKPNGRLFIFEHNPLNPLTVHAVNTCSFDENARLIRGGIMKRRLKQAGFVMIVLRYRIFFPRAFAKLRPLDRYLTGVPFGAQYYALARKS